MRRELTWMPSERDKMLAGTVYCVVPVDTTSISRR
jgi:hypothetical protein